MSNPASEVRLGLWLAGIFAAGVLVRVALALATDGSDFDLESYRLASEQLRVGLLDFYSALGGEATRWPYLPGFLPWVASSREISDSTGIEFQLVLGLPAMAADLAIAWFVQDFLARRGATPKVRLVAAALVVLGPPFFVTSGYIPHFDSVAFLLAVAAVWWWDHPSANSPRRALVAGVLIGIGCALKTTPLLLVLALLPTCRSNRERVILVGAAAAIPIAIGLPFLLSTPTDLRASLSYGGVPGAGGLSLLIQPEMAERWLTEFHDLNRLNTILFENSSLWSVLAFSLLAIFLIRRRTDASSAAVLIWLTFYVTGPAFFFQYLIWGLPFLVMAGRLRLVLLIELAVAVPMALFYNGPWDSGEIPLVYGVLMIGLWIGLAVTLVRSLREEHASSKAERRLGSPPLPELVTFLNARLGSAPPTTPRPSNRDQRWPVAILLLTLIVFGALSILFVARAASPGDVFTGSDGPFAADQLTYLAWVQDASEHILNDNDYSLNDSPHIYLHPMFAISGLVDRATGALQLSYLLWKPVALLALFGGFWVYVRRMVTGKWAQLAALAIALFFATPFGALSDWLGLEGERGEGLVSLAGESLNAALLWGYLPAAIAVGLMPLFLLGIERIVEPERRRDGWSKRRYLLLTSAAGLLASWIHPWQGQALLLILLGVAIWKPPGMSRNALLVPGVATLLPLLYYLALATGSPAWELARQVNAGDPLPATVVLLGLSPLLIPAALAYSAPFAGFGDRALRIWPFAALALHYSSPNVPGHAFQALALPLAILAVRGCQQLAWPKSRLAAVGGVLAVGVLTVPGCLMIAGRMNETIASRVQANLVTADEDRALTFLRDDPTPGGVLTTPYLGAVVPAFAERKVWAGHPVWTPGYSERATAADDLFAGRLDPQSARELVQSSGAAFVLSGCTNSVDIEESLDGLAADRTEFGCAVVYRVGSDFDGP